MKALFLIFHGFDEANGITKKIRYQINALKECGLDVRTCYYDISTGHRQWMIDDKVLHDFGTGVWAKIKKRFLFGEIARYVKREGIEFVYVRSDHNANPFTIRLIKQCKQAGARVVIEIPTYPYDQEYSTARMKLDLAVDRLFRHQLAKHTNEIVTFSNAEQIFGAPTIRISNGIDFHAVTLQEHSIDISQEMHLIGVAEIHYWHGYDRLVRGMAEYYRQNPTYKVYFHIVGPFSSEREQQSIQPIIASQKLEPYILLHGAQHGEQLEQLFAQSHFAIGSLGRHRSGITHIKTLKNREYAARGMAFVYSETDDDFEQMPYILKVPADETPIDVERIIAFRQQLTLSPQEIRHSIAHLSWKCQMEKVVNRALLYNNQ